MKVLIISGFLGAGKTTFIKEMMKKTNREFVIFENEFGDVGIDGSILRENKKELNNKNNGVEIFELANGCVCCNTKGNFLSSLLVIENSLRPDFLIVEPSGIAILSNILNNIKNIEYEKIQLLPTISIVDANVYFKYKEKYSDIFINQIETAKYIQLSKVNNLDEFELQSIYEDIKHINPKATIYIEDYKYQNIYYWNNLFSGELLSKEKENLITSNQKIENFTYKNAYCSNILNIINFLENLIRNHYGEISRAKGIFNSTDYSIKFDVVDKNYNLSILEKSEDNNNVVFIGINLEKEKLKNELNNFQI